MEEYLKFRKMITPAIIQVLFWIGVAMCVIMGLVTIVTGASRYGSGTLVLHGVMMLLVGPILVRVYCELVILLFRIHDVLTQIRDGRTGGAEDAATPAAPPAAPSNP